MKAIFVDARAAHEADPPVARRLVSAVMSSPVSTVDSRQSLSEALRLMVDGHVRHLVVLDDAGSYCGVVSDREIGAAWAVDSRCLSTASVASIVDATAPTIGAAAWVVTAARLMRAAERDALAVVDPKGSVVGVLTGTDLIGLLARYGDRS